ncbi:MAG: Gfo/Idh/MocA family oxidoreductase, partial [Acidobacteriota bacterium]
STANIGRNQVNPAIQASRNAELLAVASRDLARAREFAAKSSISRYYESYEALLDDTDIDAVYIPLPNSMHREWAIRAAEKGKHILCEKPLATSASDCREMQAAADANRVTLMEAFMYRFHPRTERLFELAAGGATGEIRVIRSAFTFKLARPDNIRFFSELGGGCLYDLGCYCVDVSRRLAGAQAVEAQAFAQWNDKGVDTQLTGALRFENGVVAHFDCSFMMERREFVEAAGVDGVVASPASTFVNSTEADELIQYRGREPRLVHSVPGDNHYRIMVEHFADVVGGLTPLRYGIVESIENLAVIEALYESARAGGRPIAVRQGSR